MNTITNIELFAGAGGLALGLEQAGIEGVEFVEFNHAACDTLRKNRPDWKGPSEIFLSGCVSSGHPL